MPELNNILAATGVRPYKYAYSYKIFVSSELHIQKVDPKNTYQMRLSTTLTCFQTLVQFNGQIFVNFVDAFNENIANKTLPGA